MEELGILVGLALLAAVVILPIWLIVNVLRLRRQMEDEQRLSTMHWQDLTARVFHLETQLKDLKAAGAIREPAREETEATPTRTVPASPPVPSREPTPSTSVTPTPTAPSPPIEPSPPVAPVQPRPPEPVPQHIPPAPLVSKPPVTPPPMQRAQMPPPGPPAFTQRAAERPARSGFDIEEMLGTNWLNKIGIGILVLGLAFFLAYQLQRMGPAGKVSLGIGLSAIMIAVGVRYESNERYRILARASAAGGWALLYFVSYATYHVPAAKIIDSRQLDFFLMLTVAAAIVAYSLRYRSEATTAFALVLSYLTVGIHNTSFYSLVASVVLAGAVVTLALAMNWFGLELFGILATYFTHFLWVRPVIESMGANRVEFPEFRTSIGLLAYYWLLFRFSYIYRKPASVEQEQLSSASALLNGFCLLALLRYQSVHPEWAFWALLAFGAIELALSAIAARRRRTAFIVLATLGSALLVAAFPFRYSGSDLSVLWLVAAETFLLAGVFLKEVVFRRIGLIAFGVVTAQMLFDTGASLIESRITSGTGTPVYTTAVLFAIGAAISYLNSHWVRIRWRELFHHEFDSLVIDSLTYFGGLLTLLALWFAFPGMWTAVLWATLALLLGIIGDRFEQTPLAIQGNLMAVAAIVRLVTLNFSSSEQWHGLSLRLVTVGATALLLYAAAPFARAADSGQKGPWSIFTAAYTWAASILLGVLIWYEVAPLNVALAWMVLGIVLLEISLSLGASFLLWQGFAALAASFARIFFANLDVTIVPGQLNPRLWRLLVMGAAYAYCDWRLRRAAVSTRNSDLQTAGTIFSYAGTITFAALLFAELQPSWIAAGWAALGLVMIAASWRQRRRDFLHQSFLLALAVAFRAATYNFFRFDVTGTSFWFSEKLYVGVAIALLFAASPIAFAIRRSPFRPRTEFMLDHRPEQVFFFIPFGLLTALIAIESTRGNLTLTWGAEGLTVFLFALLVGERSFRLAGLSLLLLCVLKIFVIDVWGLDPQSRYITLIVLGGALVLVSFLYTRYKENFRKYL